MWNKERGVQAFLACVTMLFGLSSAMPVLSADSSSAALTGAKAEEGRNAQESDQVPVAPPGESELVPELEDRLVILPEIKREGERFFLSSFKLPDKLTFAGQAIPLDNWQVRERIEYEFYQFLEDQGESIILAKRTGRCFAPAEKQLAEAGLPDDLKYMLLVESKCIAAAYSRDRKSVV